jgi:zinc/manganese transport system substrate-binding protein
MTVGISVPAGETGRMSPLFLISYRAAPAALALVARRLAALGLAAAALMAAPARAEPIAIVAAENVYGDVAQQIGGSAVAVLSVLSNPDQDPHLFEARASIARAVAAAPIVIVNGAGYDLWMAKLLAAAPRAGRTTIEVATLRHRKPGDNPHLWYDPATMPAVATALADALARLDPARRADYAANLDRFRAALRPLEARIAALRQAYAGAPVTATEPVAGYLAAALGLAMRNERFQLAVMNGTEPSAGDIARFEDDLRRRAVRVLIYNSQSGGPLTERMRALAAKSGVPVVGMSETMPAGLRYQEWMLAQLGALEHALSGSRP